MVTKNPDKPVSTRRPRPASVQGVTAEAPTSASSWKKATVGGTLVSVPSGNTALIRTPGMSAFIASGIIPNSLLSIIQESMVGTDTEQSTESAMAKMMDDPDRLKQLVELADNVCVDICLDPKVFQPPRDQEGVPVPFDSPLRSEEKLYVDEVDFNDKMFLFNVAVGGPRDLEKFRTQ